MSDEIFFDSITLRQFFDVLSEAEDVEIPLRCFVCRGVNWSIAADRPMHYDPSVAKWHYRRRLEFRLTCDRCGLVLRFDAETLGFPPDWDPGPRPAR